MSKRVWLVGARSVGMVVSVTLVLCVGAIPAHAEIDAAAVRVEMNEIYASMRVLLPLSVDDAAFRSAERRDEIHAALKRLERRASNVSMHVAGDDQRMLFLAGSLSLETTKAKEYFERGRHTNAQFVVQRLTDFCVACHTRIPSAADSPLAEGFVSAGALAKLAPAQRASIQVATRRFEDALETYEALFASPDVRPTELLRPLSEYLRVSIRVKNDLARPREVLKKLVQREDVWTMLRADVEGWISAIDVLIDEADGPPSLARARAVLEMARMRLPFSLDRRAGLVEQFVASSELHRYLELNAGHSGPAIAEAYYLLGMIEAQTTFGTLAAESDFYLETAVRMAPTGPIGRKAFDLLEERTVLGWTGSRGTQMPNDVRDKLEALRLLVDGGDASVRVLD
jgi:hypothetical protein